MSSVANKVIKNTGWLYAKMSITMFISLLITRLILQSLGASDFGIYSTIGGAVVFFMFLNNALTNATVRYLTYTEGQFDREKKKIIFNICTVLHIIIAFLIEVILVAAGFILFNGVFNFPQDRISASYVVYGCVVFGLLFDILRVPYDAVLNSHENMKYYAIVGILESLLKLCVAIACFYSPFDKLILYSILIAIIPVISFLIILYYCTRNYEECIFSPKKFWNNNVSAEIIKFASWNLLNGTSSMFGFYGQGIILNHFFGTLLNAAYGIATQLTGQIMAFSSNMMKAVIPVITKTEGGGDRLLMLYRATIACKYSFLILSFFAIPLILEMDYILHIWLGALPQWAVTFSQMALVVSMLEQLCVAYHTAINAEGHIETYNKVMGIFYLCPLFLLGLVFFLGSSPILLYVVRILWSCIIGAGIMVYFMNRNCGMKYRLFLYESLFPCLFATILTLIIGIIPIFLMDQSLIRFVCTTIMSMLGYFVGAWFIAIKPDEKTVFYSIIHDLFDRFRLNT